MKGTKKKKIGIWEITAIRKMKELYFGSIETHKIFCPIQSSRKYRSQACHYTIM